MANKKGSPEKASSCSWQLKPQAPKEEVKEGRAAWCKLELIGRKLIEASVQPKGKGSARRPSGSVKAKQLLPELP